MEQLQPYILAFITGLASPALLLYLSKNWIVTRLTESIKHEYDEKLEELKATIQEASYKKQEKWNQKRIACKKALELANAVLSNYTYNIEGKEIKPQPQFMEIKDARKCLDELACTCEGTKVIEHLKIILFDKNVTPDKIIDLRNAIREELDFPKTAVDIDREKPFIAKLNCVPSEDSTK